jgi:hypothetical protein
METRLPCPGGGITAEFKLYSFVNRAILTNSSATVEKVQLTSSVQRVVPLGH